MSKKILSVALALIFVISTFAVSAFAISGVTYEEEGAGYTQTWALEATDNGDGTWTVDVLLTADYYVGAIQFAVLNSNPAGAVLTNVEAGADLTEDYGADVQANLETGLVAIIPNPAEDASLGLDLDAGVVATLTYEVTAGATISIDGNDAKTKAKPDGKLIAVRMSEDVLTTGNMVYGQIVDATAATADLGSVAAEPADLAKTAGAEAGIVIDTNKTFGGLYDGAVYGFSKGASATVFRTVAYLQAAFEATNNGTLEFNKYSNAYGTGATITVKNSDGSVAKVYVVVIFGDVDCNGTINVNDAALVKNAVNGSATIAENSIQRMAANCQPVNNATVMHNLAINDASYIKNYIGTSSVKFSPATLASYQYKFNVNYQ